MCFLFDCNPRSNGVSTSTALQAAFAVTLPYPQQTMLDFKDALLWYTMRKLRRHD